MPTVSSACRLCVNIHHYAPPRIVLQQAAALYTLGYAHCACNALADPDSPTGGVGGLPSLPLPYPLRFPSPFPSFLVEVGPLNTARVSGGAL